MAHRRAIFHKSGEIRNGKKKVGEVTNPSLYSEGLKFSYGSKTYYPEIFHNFPQFLQENVPVVPQMRSWQFLPRTFQIVTH
jgi:hypothetical protein